jgi:hypothetical protein
LFPGQEGAGTAVVGFGHLVDFGHQADGFFQGDDDLLAVGDVFVGKHLQPTTPLSPIQHHLLFSTTPALGAPPFLI